MSYTKFVIISSPRTGSTSLSSILNCNPKIICYQELFDDSEGNELLDDDKRQNLKYSVEKATRIRNENPELFLQDVLYRSYSKTVKAVGFKFHYDHADTFPMVLDYLQKDRSIKVLHLKRHNILDSYISLLKALKTRQWINVQGQEDIISGNIRFVIDYHACRDYFIKIENYWYKFDQIFKDHKVLNLEYEAITSRKKDAILQEFLTAPIRNIESPLIKHPFTKHSFTIKNYQELKEKFQNTKWIDFFE